MNAEELATTRHARCGRCGHLFHFGAECTYHDADGPCFCNRCVPERPEGPVSAETQRVVLEMEVAMQAGRVAFGETRLVAALRAGIRRLLQLETQKKMTMH